MSPGVNDKTWFGLQLHFAVTKQKNLFKNVNVVSFSSQSGVSLP